MSEVCISQKFASFPLKRKLPTKLSLTRQKVTSFNCLQQKPSPCCRLGRRSASAGQAAPGHDATPQGPHLPRHLPAERRAPRRAASPSAHRQPQETSPRKSRLSPHTSSPQPRFSLPAMTCPAQQPTRRQR